MNTVCLCVVRTARYTLGFWTGVCRPELGCFSDQNVVLSTLFTIIFRWEEGSIHTKCETTIIDYCISQPARRLKKHSEAAHITVYVVAYVGRYHASISCNLTKIPPLPFMSIGRTQVNPAISWSNSDFSFQNPPHTSLHFLGGTPHKFWWGCTPRVTSFLLEPSILSSIEFSKRRDSAVGKV